MKQSEDDNPLELYKAQNIRNFEEYWNQLPETTIAWLAGLLQGEAYFYIDDRNRSTSNDPNYRPPPAIQINGIRLSMIEKDLMNEVAKLVEQNLNLEKRLVFVTGHLIKKKVKCSKANNFVYKVNVSARNKVQIILKSIFPYVRGAKKLTICLSKNNSIYAKSIIDGVNREAKLKLLDYQIKQVSRVKEKKKRNLKSRGIEILKNYGKRCVKPELISFFTP